MCKEAPSIYKPTNALTVNVEIPLADIKVFMKNNHLSTFNHVQFSKGVRLWYHGIIIQYLRTVTE